MTSGIWDEATGTEPFYRAMAEHVPQMLFAASPTGAVEYFNQRWYRYTGLAAESSLGSAYLASVHGDDLETVRELWREAIASADERSADLRLRGADQTYRWHRIALAPQLDDARHAVRWLGTIVDTDVHHRAIDALELLADSGEKIQHGESLEGLLVNLARAALGGVADLSVFDFRENDALPQRIAIGSAGFEWAAEIIRPFDLDVADSATPIARAISERKSLLVACVDDEYVDANVAPAARRAAWRAVGIRSLVTTPLVVDDKPFGSLTLLRLGGSAPFSRNDLRVAEEIARRTSAAIENVRLRDRARTEAALREDRFRRIADAIPQLMWIAADDGSVDWVNGQWLAFTGEPIDKAVTLGWMSFVHPDDRRDAIESWVRAVTSGDTFQCEYRLRGNDGRYRYFLARATPMEAPSGRTWYGTNTDIDEAWRAARTLEVFAHVGEELTESLGLQSTLDAVMQVVVPDFADWAFITLADEADDLYVRAVYHADPGTAAELNRMIGMRYARAAGLVGSPAAIRARQPLLYTNAVYQDASKIVEPEVLAIFWNAVGFDSVLVIPLIVGSAARGTLTVLMSGSARRFRPADVPFFTELARRIAPAIANAESYERERHVASTFQTAALPASLPATDGFVFSAVYEAGRAEALVGGDWYDAFALMDGRLVVSIGDVAGSGLRAAVTMANVRQAIRGVAHVHADPELMLEAGDRALRAENPDSFATAFVGVIDPVAGTIAYKSAGHAPALLARPDGSIDELAFGGLPLGLRAGDAEPPSYAKLGVGSALYLYTDGLTESTRDMLEGERRLREAIGAARATAPHERAGAIYASVLADGSSDDVAILCVSVLARRNASSWIVDTSDPVATKTVREEAFAQLGLDRTKAGPMRAAEVIFSEIVGNVLRYAQPVVEIVVERDAGRCVLHVLDSGPGFEFMPKLPPDPYCESGRGLFLISALAANFNVTRRPGGGSHARVVFAT